MTSLLNADTSESYNAKKFPRTIKTTVKEFKTLHMNKEGTSTSYKNSK